MAKPPIPRMRLQRTIPLRDAEDSTDMARDFSSEEKAFEYRPEEDEAFLVYSARVFIEGVKGFAADRYGKNLILANGIEAEVDRVDPSITLTKIFPLNGTRIHTISDWVAVSSDLIHLDFGKDLDALIVMFSTTKTFGVPMMLDHNTTFRLRLHDDFSSLSRHVFALQGVDPYRDYKGDTID